MNTCQTLNYYCKEIGLGGLLEWQFLDQSYVSKKRFDEVLAVYVAEILRAAFDVKKELISVSIDYAYGTDVLARNTKVVIKSIVPSWEKIQSAFAAFKREAAKAQEVKSFLESVHRAPANAWATITEEFLWASWTLKSVTPLLKSGHYLLRVYDENKVARVVHLTPGRLQFIQKEMQKASTSN